MALKEYKPGTAFSGVIVVEAIKQVYAGVGVPVKKKVFVPVAALPGLSPARPMMYYSAPFRGGGAIEDQRRAASAFSATFRAVGSHGRLLRRAST